MPGQGSVGGKHGGCIGTRSRVQMPSVSLMQAFRAGSARRLPAGQFAFVSWSANPIPRYFLGGEKLMDEGLKLLEEQMKGKKRSVFSPSPCRLRASASIALRPA